jgi:hypothetical protein
MTRKPIGLTAPFRKENKMPMEIHKDKIVMRAGRYDLEQKRPWSNLIRGVRVEGDTVVILAKGGNEAARELCAALIEEKTK